MLNEKKKIFILALGQLVKSNLSESVNAFAKILTEESRFFPFAFISKLKVFSALLFDKFYYKTIEKYKLGQIDSEEFERKIRAQLGISENISSQRFKDAWNCMCNISSKALSEIVELVKEKKQKDFTICVVSGTNPLQYNYVLDQINDKLKENNLPNLEDAALISVSFREKTLSFPSLIQNLIRTFGLDKAENKLISLNYGITEEMLRLRNASFEMIPSKDDYNDKIKANLPDRAPTLEIQEGETKARDNLRQRQNPIIGQTL